MTIINKSAIKYWMNSNVKKFPTSTKLAEAAAHEFKVYEDDFRGTIPKIVFDLAIEVSDNE